MNRSRRSGRFFGLVLALSAPIYALGSLFPALNKVLPFGLPLGASLIVVPFAAALALVNKDEGAAGVQKLLRRTLEVERGQGRWLLLSTLLMPGALVLSYAVQRALGQELPAASLNWGAIPGQFTLFFVTSFFEELGWMGYAIDPLQENYGALAASLLLGSVWAGWHVILYLQMGRPVPWVFWPCVCSVAARVLMVWIYNHAGQSVLTSVLFHTTLNLSEFNFPDQGSHYDPQVAGLILAACAALLWPFRNRTLPSDACGAAGH